MSRLYFCQKCLEDCVFVVHHYIIFFVFFLLFILLVKLFMLPVVWWMKIFKIRMESLEQNLRFNLCPTFRVFSLALETYRLQRIFGRATLVWWKSWSGIINNWKPSQRQAFVSFADRLIERLITVVIIHFVWRRSFSICPIYFAVLTCLSYDKHF